ncbi:MAG: flagellar basal body-associated FliL family protein [Phycisphaerae bacterium]|nr:flagellar basal body-associated FliL family protein [Phycisphaerae bacterium]
MHGRTLILAGCVCLACGCTLEGLANDTGSAASNARANPAGEAPLVYHTLEPAMATLARPDQARYLRATVAVGVSQKASPQVRQRLESDWLALREKLVRCLAGRSLDELVGAEGLRRLQNDIRLRLNDILGEGVVRRVVFTEFAVH